MRKNLTKREQKDLLTLRSAYEMHFNSKQKALLANKVQNAERLDEVLSQVYQQMAAIDPEFAQECYINMQNRMQDNFPHANYGNSNTDIFTELKAMDGNTPQEPSVQTEDKGIFDDVDPDDFDIDQWSENIDKMDDKSQEDVPESASEVQIEMPESNVEQPKSEDSLAMYDIIPLPSKGECYRNKKDRVKVAYLTAADENIITSPNLYESGEVMNILLKRKVLDNDINVDELISGDVDAIMVWLRGTAYGSDFPIEATIPNTTKTVKTTVDLGKLNYKPFSLVGDENGHFTFVLPRTKAEIKFKFLTKKEERLLQKLNKRENNGIASIELKEAIAKVKKVLKSDTRLSDGDRNAIIAANDKLEKWSASLNSQNNTTSYTKSVTNSMEMEIVAINGNTDKQYIHKFVCNMPASDSLAFRRYIYDNQPGVDFEVKVGIPESEGGGSFSCFLEWDDYVFWSI